jgi:hypothetical protein
LLTCSQALFDWYFPLKSGFFRYCFSFLLCATTTVLYSAELRAESSSSDSNGFFALPMEIDSDSGADNGDAIIYRLMPLYSHGLPYQEDWKMIHLNLLTVAETPGGVPGRPGNPEPVPGDEAFGLGDLVHAALVTPTSTGNMIWGLGAMLSIPIATDDKLGSGKWSVGPAFRITYRSGLWNIGAFGGQTWSFAGDSDRSDVSQLIVRGAIRRELPNNWFFVSAPTVTANWNASGQKWLVPMGGGIGKVFSIRSDPWALSVQGYYNVVKPDGAPNWALRLSLIAAIRL